MGWFLSGRAQKQDGARGKAGKGRRVDVERKPWDPQRTLAGLKWFGVAVLGVSMVVGWWQAERALVGYVGSRKAAALTPDHVEMVGMPAWMNPQVEEDLRLLAVAQVSQSPLDRRGLAAAHHALSQNAWVEKVERVERVAIDRVRVEAAYRQPAAFIEQGGVCYLVDTQGVRLPGTYHPQQASQLPLPVLRGVRAVASLEGQLWQGGDVQAGLKLVAELSGEPYRDQVEAIDVSGRDSRGRIHMAILTGQGGVARWGLAPGQEHSVEPPAATKRAWLGQLVRETGYIDAGGRQVDLYRGALFVHLPAGREIGFK